MKKVISCDLVRADVPTANGRIYPRAVVEEMVRKVNAVGPERKLFGQLGQEPTDPKTYASSVSHVVLSAKLSKEGELSAEIEVLDRTRAGQQLKLLIEQGYQMTLAPRGSGSVSAGGVIGDDYKLASFDVVPMPAKPAD